MDMRFIAKVSVLEMGGAQFERNRRGQLARRRRPPERGVKGVNGIGTDSYSGLHVNDDSQVCTEEDELIDGLFAVGNVQGDFFGLNYPVHCPGVSHGRCLTFGQLVGEALATDTVITKLEFK